MVVSLAFSGVKLKFQADSSCLCFPCLFWFLCVGVFSSIDCEAPRLGVLLLQSYDPLEHARCHHEVNDNWMIKQSLWHEFAFTYIHWLYIFRYTQIQNNVLTVRNCHKLISGGFSSSLGSHWHRLTARVYLSGMSGEIKFVCTRSRPCG